MGFYVDKASLGKLQRKLENDFPREASKEGQKVLSVAAKELRKKIREAAPVDSGDLRRSIYVKKLRDKFAEPQAIDIRSSRGGVNRGKKRKADAFYWRFLEYGTKKMAPRPFVGPTVEKFKPQLQKYFEEYRNGLAEEFNKKE